MILLPWDQASALTTSFSIIHIETNVGIYSVFVYGRHAIQGLTSVETKFSNVDYLLSQNDYQNE